MRPWILVWAFLCALHSFYASRDTESCVPMNPATPYTKCWLCWGLTSQSTIFQSYRDGAIASWVINQYFRGVKCLAQGHNTAAVGLEPRTSRSGVRHSTTEPPRSPYTKCVYEITETYLWHNKYSSATRPRGGGRYFQLWPSSDVMFFLCSSLLQWSSRSLSESKVMAQNEQNSWLAGTEMFNVRQRSWHKIGRTAV